MSDIQECVKCQASLKPVVFNEVEIDRCEGCGGLWFDKGELKTLWNTQGDAPSDDGKFEEAIAKLAKAAPSASATTRDDDAVLKVGCPSCKGKLNAVVFGTTRIEQCSACDGVFLDAGELAKAMELLDSGEASTILALAASVFTSGQIG